MGTLVQLKRAHRCHAGVCLPGSIVTVPGRIADKMIARGHAEAVKPRKKKKAKKAKAEDPKPE
jgi:hypothetical protein